MTAPVRTEQPQKAKVAMTSPVRTELKSNLRNMKVSFVMPKEVRFLLLVHGLLRLLPAVWYGGVCLGPSVP